MTPSLCLPYSAGHLLALVRDADQQQARMQHAYEQQALE